MSHIRLHDERRRPIRFEITSIRARIAVASIAAGIFFPLAGFFALVSAPAAHAGPGESDFAVATNALRAQHGLVAYRTCPDLTAVARSWAAQMAASNTLAHNPGRQSQVTNWRAVGENVGMGRSTSGIQAALVASPSHLVNLLSPTFVEVGYGTAVSADGHLYVDEVFRTPMSAPCAGGAALAAVKPPAKTAAPARTSPTVRSSAPTTIATAPPPSAAPAVTPPVAPPTAAPAVILARLAGGTPPAPDEDSIGRAFTVYQTFSNAIRP